MLHHMPRFTLGGNEVLFGFLTKADGGTFILNKTVTKRPLLESQRVQCEIHIDSKDLTAINTPCN